MGRIEFKSSGGHLTEDLFDNSVVKVIVGIAVVLLIIFPLVGNFVNRMELIGTEARIEQLRSDAAQVNIAESEDIMGQVAEANQRIRSMQAYNRIP